MSIKKINKEVLNLKNMGNPEAYITADELLIALIKILAPNSSIIEELQIIIKWYE